MDLFDIYIAYVSWDDDGKRRPVLILETNADTAIIFNITTQYENKSETVRTKYFIINDWDKTGLNKQSYIDTNKTVTLPLTAIDNNNRVGRLTANDEKRLIEFINTN